MRNKLFAAIIMLWHVVSAMAVNEVGKIEGIGSVSATGAATYQIPISLPTDEFGYSPKVEIVYNSQTKNGLLGYGWNLSASSAISLCRKTIYYDEIADAVDTSSDGPYSLDGKRLVSYTDGNSSFGTKYSPEDDPTTLVVQYGDGFRAYKKDGSKMDFGISSDSRIGPSNKYWLWLLKQSTDLRGRTISYSYSGNPQGNSFFLSRIDYDSDKSVRFNYEIRPDASVSWFAGQSISSSYRLVSISIYVKETKLLEYAFSYEYDGYYSKLSGVQLFGKDGSSYAPTEFAYEGKSIETNLSVPLSVGKEHGRMAYGDFDGDGRKDFLTYSLTSGVVSIYKSSKNWGGFSFQRIDTISVGKSLVEAYVVDADGNGLDDIVTITLNGEKGHHTIYSVENGQIVNKASFEMGKGTLIFGDYTGNGKPEYLNMYFYDRKVYDTQGNCIGNSFAVDWDENTKKVYFPSQKFPLDFNGDGKEEIAIYGRHGLKIYGFKDDHFEELTSFAIGDIDQSYTVSPADFNGDGYVDILARRDGQGKVYLCTGISFVEQSYSVSIPDEYAVMLGDFNCDGRADLFHLAKEPNGYQFVTKIFNGNGFTTYSTEATVYPTEEGKTKSFHEYSTIADFDGDGRPEFGCFFFDDKVVIKQFKDEQELLLQSVTDGLGLRTSFEYSSTNSSSVCSHNYSNATYPVSVLSNAMELVTKVEIGNSYGFGNVLTTYYTYKNPRVHLEGKGFLGFEEIVCETPQEIITSQYSLFKANYPCYYPYLSFQEHKSVSGKLISRDYYNVTVRPLSHSKPYRFVPYITWSTHTDYLTGNAKNEFNGIDNYGNIVTKTTIHSDSFEEILQNSYLNDVSKKWTIGLPKEILKIQKSSQKEEWSQKKTFSYNSRNMPISISTFEGNLESPVNKETFLYDSFGNIITKNLWKCSQINPLSTFYTFSSDGCRLQEIKDVFNKDTKYSYDTNHRLVGVTYPSGLTSSFNYDGMGRVVKEEHNDGSSISIGYVLDNSLSRAVWRKEELGIDGSSSKTWYDIFGREVGHSINDFQGNDIISEKRYNAKGQLYSQSLPYKEYSQRQLNSMSYDEFGRLVYVIKASGGYESYTYRDNVVTSTVDGISTTRVYDRRGNLVQVRDSTGDINYTLRPDGQPSSVETLGITTTFEYDSFGRRTSITDSSGGQRTYEYNDAGDVNKITDADGRAVVIDYDMWGRVIAEQRPEFSTEYRYNGKNQLTDVISTNETGIEYSYDSLGRLNRRKDLLPEGKYLLREFNYDQGCISTISYSNQNVFLGTESRTYANGVLKEISFGEKPVWTLVDENNLGQCTESRSGNIVKTTTYSPSGILQGKTMKSPISTYQNLLLGIDASTGNLSWRKDSQRSLTENFEYDELNRLTLYGNNTVSYDNRGNILTKDDAGLNLYYEEENRPYAVTSLSGDFNRNLVNYSNQRIVFNSFECPDTLEDAGVVTTFVYNASGERVMMANRRSDLPTRYYIENNYEEEEIGSINNYRLYLGGDAYSAPAVYISDGSNGEMYYLGRDHLGSITHITNEKGTLLYEYSYDAWGRLRDPQTQELYSVGQEPSLFLGRGYCGHEHLPWCGLINMNARLYDPAIGRFLSPDPYIQDPGNSQNFNRYSYCLNNPLKYTDPSGEWALVDDLFAMIVGGTINLGVSLLQGNVNSFKHGVSLFLVGALAGETALYTGPMASSIVLGVGNSITNQYFSNNSVSLGQVVNDVTLSLMFSTAGQLIGKYTGDAIGTFVGKIGVSGPAFNQMISESAENALSGSILSGALALGYGGNLDEVLSAMKYGGINGAVLGAVSGFASGIQYARANRISPWTGEKVHGHHSFPKSLGGDINQPLTPMSASRHIDLHNDMREYLKNTPKGNMNPRKGFDGKMVRKKFTVPTLFEQTKGFYDTYPYKYWDARLDFYRNNHLKWWFW